jgi:outer membrane protein OmpA-like peptidoglycan-associated protein
MKKLLFILLFSTTYASAQVDTFNIHFNLREYTLTKKSIDHIDQLFYLNKIVHGQKLIILGYADYLGGDEDNMVLSEKRATHVKDYLISSGFSRDDITVCAGKGEIDGDEANNEGKPRDRKVQIIIDKSKSSIQLKSATSETPLFDMAKIKDNDVIPLDRVLFGSGSYEIEDSSYKELTKLKAFLRKNPSVRIQIEGHSCCTQWNYVFGRKDVDTGVNAMSTKRARAVYEFLVNNGIDSTRMKYVGLGGLHPFVKPERTPADEAKNRRVAIRILSR